MKLNDKEFYELREQFEKEFASDIYNIFYGHRIDKESKDTTKKSKVYYQDGFVDKMFKIYMIGYSYGKWAELNKSS